VSKKPEDPESLRGLLKYEAFIEWKQSQAVHGDYGVNIMLEEPKATEIWAFVDHMERRQKFFRYVSRGMSWAH
jgi:hypothetical protein